MSENESISKSEKNPFFYNYIAEQIKAHNSINQEKDDQLSISDEQSRNDNTKLNNIQKNKEKNLQENTNESENKITFISNNETQDSIRFLTKKRKKSTEKINNKNNETKNQTQTNTSSFTSEKKFPIFQIQNNEKINNKNKTKGRISNKDKKNGKIGIKTKYHIDNIICKIKRILIETNRKFLNKKLKKISELKKIDFKQILFNRELIEKSIREILSVKISEKYKDCKEDHNKLLIDNIYKMNENQKNLGLLINILNKTFLESLQICRGYKCDEKFKEEYSDEMKELFEEIIEDKLKKENEFYKIIFWSVIDEFEIIFKYRKKKLCTYEEY